MPKLIELTVEIDVQKVSCPGVWLCQDGRVSLTVFALGSSYQTCLLPPLFPLNFKDVFYFKKRFQETCTLNNICCLLKEEMIYCELVQWCEDSEECTILAQYLGTLNDVLFPPNLCAADGVDLLMRRSKHFPSVRGSIFADDMCGTSFGFLKDWLPRNAIQLTNITLNDPIPNKKLSLREICQKLSLFMGILSPKIEIATKVRLDEVWNQQCNALPTLKFKKCSCRTDVDAARQKQVCHSAQYHRRNCTSPCRTSPLRSRSRSRSDGSRSYSSFDKQQPPSNFYQSNSSPSRFNPRIVPANYYVYNMATPDATWRDVTTHSNSREQYSCELDDFYDGNENSRSEGIERLSTPNLDRIQKLVLESRYIDQDIGGKRMDFKRKKYSKGGLTPCVCQICKRYHELFHLNGSTNR